MLIADTEFKFPVCIDPTILQFDQSLDKFALRLSKQKVNLTCCIVDIYDFLNNMDNFGGYGARMLSRLAPDANKPLDALIQRLMNTVLDIQKDRTQEIVDRLQRFGGKDVEEAVAKEQKLMVDDPYHYPTPVRIGDEEGCTAGYNFLIEDARVMHFFLTDPMFHDEAAAKAHEFIRPEKEFETVRPRFVQLSMTPGQSYLLYERFFKAKITDPLFPAAQQEKKDVPDADHLPAQQLVDQVDQVDQKDSKEASVQKPLLHQAEWQRIHQASRQIVVFPRHLLLFVAHESLKMGVKPEVLEEMKKEAATNLDRSRSRYVKRIRRPHDEQTPAPNSGGADNQQAPPNSGGGADDKKNE